MVFAYSKMGRMMALNIETISSFSLPHLLEVSGFRMLSVCFALVMVMFIYCENVSFGLRVIPKSFGCFLLVMFDCLSDKICVCVYFNLSDIRPMSYTLNKTTILPLQFVTIKHYYEGQSISNETFLITQVCNDW